MRRWSFNNSGGKQAGFKWHSWTLNMHWNKTARSQANVRAISAVQHNCKGLCDTVKHHNKETPTAKSVMLKSSNCLEQWAWFHRLFSSSPHWDFECGVFALKVGPAVCRLYNTMWYNILMKDRLYTHTPTVNPLLSWSPGSSVLSFKHSRAEWAPENKACFCPWLSLSATDSGEGSPCCALCQQNNTDEGVPAVVQNISNWDDAKKGNTFILF